MKEDHIKKINHFFLSLNQENDISILPDQKYLKHIYQYFPGTFLEVKIYLNKTYFKEVLPQ